MRTVVHFISGDETEQQTGLSIVRNLLDDESGSIDDVAVVVQGPGIEAIRSGADGEDQVRSLLADGVAFAACENTLEAEGIDRSELPEGVETVPAGAVEVTRLQDEGYAYVRP